MRPLFRNASIGLVVALSTPGNAYACGTPTERWYREASDVIFDGNARCDVEARSCWVRITHVSKNLENLALERRTIEVDFQNFSADWIARNPDRVVIFCGSPLFEPEQEQFTARFYANLDEATSELIVRRAQIRGEERYRED